MIVAALDVFGGALEFIVDRHELLLEKTWEHVLLSAAALAVSIAIAVPARRASRPPPPRLVPRGQPREHRPRAADARRDRRGFTFLGVGFTNVMVALVVLAVPPILTNAYVAVDEVDPDAVEAARGMGMPPLQVLRRVELPLALPLLFAGIRTAAVFVVATATIAAIAGGGGLGEILVNQAAYDVEGLVAAALCVSLLALAADAGLGAVQRALTPPGLKEEFSVRTRCAPGRLTG